MTTSWLRYSCILLFLAMCIPFTAGCSSSDIFRSKPPGEVLGYCTGTMRLANGGQKPFQLDLIGSDGDYRLYLTIPGMYRYRPVDDITFSKKEIHLSLLAPRQNIDGELIGDKLTVSGSFKGYSGMITLPLDQDEQP